jgi:hypothetical protein
MGLDVTLDTRPPSDMSVSSGAVSCTAISTGENS